MTTYCCFFFAYIVFASNVQQFYIMCMKWGKKTQFKVVLVAGKGRGTKPRENLINRKKKRSKNSKYMFNWNARLIRIIALIRLSFLLLGGRLRRSRNGSGRGRCWRKFRSAREVQITGAILQLGRSNICSYMWEFFKRFILQLQNLHFNTFYYFADFLLCYS